MSDHQMFNRFSGLVDLDAIASVSVCQIGAGGIGVPTAIALAKMGVRTMQIWDFDNVEEVNLGTQLYGPDHVGQAKVFSLAEHVKNLAPWCEIDARNETFEDQSFEKFNVVIAAVDSLRVRRQVFRSMLRNPKENQILIDPRMGAEVFTCYSVLPTEDQRWYQETLMGEAVEAPCTEKATFYTGFAAGSLAVAMFKSWIKGERDVVDMTFDLRNLSLLTCTKNQKIEMLENAS